MISRARLAWCWTFVIFALCWFPRAYMGDLERRHRPFFVPNFDKFVHMGIFAVFAFVWMRVAPSKLRGVWIFLAGLGIAALTEVVQESRFVNRDASVGDGLADVIGVVLGLLAFEVVRRFSRKSSVAPDA